MSDIEAAGQLSFSPRRVIADAAHRTGADFDFLMRTAARESSFDPGAKARTSSAAGLFQFIEQTWFAMLHRHGDKHGYGELANAVKQDAHGRFSIADPELRARALDLRFEPQAASVMAGELAAENAAHLRASIGREPSSGELYAAHFLGAGGAARLIQAVDADPGVNAESLFPEAAAANRAVFRPEGRPIRAADLLARLAGEAGSVTAPEQVARARRDPVVGEPTKAPARAGVSGYAAFGAGASVLSPALVELLASLDAPAPARRKG
ncbi:MAG: transglycosylase SLT domain-containing protein [Oceanicaulis sp.]